MSRCRYFVFTVLQTIIGQWSRTDGTGRSSLGLLSETLATEGLAASVSAFHTPYRDTGLFGTYLVCPPEKVEDACFEVLNEWVRIGQHVTDAEVARAVSRLKGQLLMVTQSLFLLLLVSHSNPFSLPPSLFRVSMALFLSLRTLADSF